MLVYYLLYVMKYNYDETVLFQAKHIILVAFKNYLKQLMSVNNEILFYLLTTLNYFVSMKINNYNEFLNILYQHVLILKPYSEIPATRLFPNSSPS